LLRKDEAHDLTKFDILQKELNVKRIWWILRRVSSLVLNKVLFAYHLHI